MAKFDDSIPRVQARTRTEWREWLVDNHATSVGVWLVYWKVATKKPTVRYEEAVREALCFGWIDSKIKSIDDERYMQVFTPRKPGSGWSKQNKRYIEELTGEGIMTEAGTAKIETAKKDGSWSLLDDAEALVVPPELKRAFKENIEAKTGFDSYRTTEKKAVLFWISSAKRAETRDKRAKKTIDAAMRGEFPLAPQALPRADTDRPGKDSP